MSTHIQDALYAIRVSKEQAGNKYSDVYILLAQGGDNNVISNQTGRRATDWYSVAISEDWGCLGRVTEMASACCGGCLKLYGRDTSPETYIRAWRKAIDAASPLVRASQAGFSLRAYARFPKAATEGQISKRPSEQSTPEDGVIDSSGHWVPYRRHHYEEIIQSGRIPRDETHWGLQCVRFDFNLNQPEDFGLWYHWGNGKPRLEVSGPKVAKQCDLFAA